MTLLLAACNSGGPAIDAAAADARADAAAADGRIDAGPLTYAQCEALVVEWDEIVDGLSLACEDHADCAHVGAQDGFGCGCEPMLACGEVVQRAAYDASGAPAIEAEFLARCELGFCDCAAPLPRCVDGYCTALQEECNPPPTPDAGQDAAGLDDAGA